jgi:hypothetical protein
LLLLDHIGSHHALIWLGHRPLEKVTARMLGDYQTRRPLPLVEPCRVRRAAAATA